MSFFQKYRLYVSAILGIILCSATLFLWFNYNASVQKSLHGKVSDTNKLVTKQFFDSFSQNVNRLQNLSHRIETTDGAYFEYWNVDATRLVSQEPSFIFVEWIDSNMVVQKVEPFEGNEEAVGLDISVLDYRNSDWIQARKDSIFNLTQWLALTQGDSAFLVDAPTYFKGDFQGTITAGMDFTNRFNQIMKGLDQYHIEIRDDFGTLFYSHGTNKGTDRFDDFTVSDSILIGDANASVWTIKMVPNHFFSEVNAIYSDRITLILTLVLCILLSVSFYFMQDSYAAKKSSVMANEKLRALIDSAPIAIYVIDADGKVVDFWNNAAEEMLGWKREEVIGELLPVMSEEYNEEVQRNMKQAIEEGGIAKKEITRKRKDGSKGQFRLNLGSITGEKDYMLVLLEDITKEKEFERQLKKSLKEKNILLKEVHHRVKNNLAIIVGLLELHKSEVEDEKTRFLLTETKNRIFSISEVHEMLYQSTNFSEISLSGYISNLINRMQATFNHREKDVAFIEQGENFKININQAIPVGLLLNELITNSYNHAFTDPKIDKPTIKISFKKKSETVEVLYSDNGIGVDIDKFEKANSMGLTIIKTLLKQIYADYELKSTNGFHLEFSFEARKKGSHSNI